MTTEEFSNGFDTLINSYTTSSSSGMSLDVLVFDEYEKSIFLTKALEELVENLYTGRLLGDPVESTEQLRRYLSDLVKTTSLSCKEGEGGISDKSVFATLPSDVWFITYESATIEDSSPCLDGRNIEVIPVTLDEYHRVKDNPFRRSNFRKALRLDVEDSKVELISEYHINTYLVRYLSRPTPIILLDLPEGLSINKETKKTECKLNPGLHRMILDAAVQLAIQSRVPSTGK